MICSLKNISINYGFKKAVEEVSFDIKTGEVLGLLGVNGAGKTTCIRAILGMLPFKGALEVFGTKPGTVDTFKRSGYAPEDGYPPDYLTGTEYLNFIAKLKIKDAEIRKTRISEMTKDFDIQPEKRIKDYSKGMRKRLVLAQAFLCSDNKFLILDEPLNGLDPIIILRLREYVNRFREAGGSILYSSHILSEIEKNCTHVFVIDKGRQLYFNTIGEFLKKYETVEQGFYKLVESNHAGVNI